MNLLDIIELRELAAVAVMSHFPWMVDNCDLRPAAAHLRACLGNFFAHARDTWSGDPRLTAYTRSEAARAARFWMPVGRARHGRR